MSQGKWAALSPGAQKASLLSPEALRVEWKLEKPGVLLGLLDPAGCVAAGIAGVPPHRLSPSL